MKKVVHILLAGSLCPLLSFGQVVDGAIGYYNDAYLFGRSNYTHGSTARMQALGGAQVSLGADMSSAGANPAGLGMLNRSVFSFTPGLNIHDNTASYLGNSVGSTRTNFNIANIGVAFNTNKGEYTNEKFKGGTFAITLSRTNDFNNEVSYRGRNSASSIIDSFIEEAGTTPLDNLSGYANSAWENYLIDPIYDEENNIIEYGSLVRGFPEQSESITTDGSQYDLNFAWGGNYNDKLYFGASLAFVTLNYQRQRVYTEQQFTYDEEGRPVVDDWIDYTSISDELTIDGSGVNGAIGLIVRPINTVTIGVSYKTPTFYSLDEESGYEHDTRWNNVSLDNGEVLNDRNFTSDLYVGQYNLRSPSKLTGGASFFLGKLGFVSGEVDIVDYASSHLKSSDFSVVADNRSIKGVYTSTLNYRGGAEFRLDNFRFRAGYAYFGDPYADSNGIDNSSRNITGGIGYRTSDFFIDLVVVNSKSQELYSPYSFSNDQPTAEFDQSTTTVAATLGFNF